MLSPVMKKFIHYYKPYRKLFFADMACATVVAAVDVSFPQILNFLTKGLFRQGPEQILSVIGLVAAGLIAMYLVKLGCEYFIASWGHIMGSRMESDMRRDLFQKMQSLPLSYYDKHNTGEMVSKVVSDLFDICEVAHHGPENLFLSVLKISGSFVLLLFIHGPLTLILFGVMLCMMVYSYFLNRRIKRAFLDNRQKIAGINVSLQDSLSGIRVVKSFAGEAQEQKKFDRSDEAFLQSKKTAYHTIGKFQAGNFFIQGLLYVVILTFGGIFIALGQMQVTDLAIYALYINIFINPITLLVNFTETFQKGLAGFTRFVEVLETPVELEDKPGAEELHEVKGEIVYDHVRFRYGEEEKEVVKGVSLHVRPGETIAFVGPSGGGKTTLCSLLPRFYDVCSGRITVDGKDVRDVTQQSLRQAIGIVQQDVYLFATTFRENIAYGKPEATEEEIIEAARNANIHDFIMSLPQGYDTPVGERGVRLSGGQKQRVSIARVFLKNPPILILDEATSALDNESEKYIQQALERLTQNRTTIVIAHRLSTIQHADCIYVVGDGQILEQGTHADLLEKQGVYAKYYRMQFTHPAE